MENKVSDKDFERRLYEKAIAEWHLAKLQSLKQKYQRLLEVARVAAGIISNESELTEIACIGLDDLKTALKAFESQ